MTSFCVGFPTLCQGPRNLFLYLFVHEREVLVTWFLFAFSEPWRLDSSRRFFIVYCTAAISLLSRWVLENLFGISYLFLGDFRFQGKDKSFHIFTGSLRALTFQFCCGSFTIKLSRKAITFVHLVCVLSFIIWGVCFVISSGVYNRRFFHVSQHAETRLVFSAGCTGAFTLSQPNIYRLGPLVRVVPDWKESLYSRKPTFFGLNIFVRVVLQRVSKCLKVSQSVSKCLTSVSKCHILKETIVCLELSRALFILINWVSSLLDCCCCSLKNTSKYGDLYWTFPFKDWISWQFRENKGCLIAL